MYAKILIAAALACAAVATHAESTPAKKELIARMLKLQQPGIESMARALAEQPAAVVLNGISANLPQNLDPKRREGILRDVQAEVRKYADEVVPVVRDRALKLAPITVGPLLDEKFSEDELRQLVTMLESPVFARFQALGNDMQRALTEKLVAETRSQVEPRVKALEQGLTRRLGVVPVPAAPAAPPASAPRAR